MDASFSVDIPKKGSMQGLQFAVNASLNVESVSVTLDGHYTSKGLSTHPNYDSGLQSELCYR